MMIQEWIYLGLVLYGFVSLIFTLSYLCLKIEDKIINKKYDFETRLHKGEILSKENIF